MPLVLAVAVLGIMFRNTDDLMDRANRSISTLNSVMIEYINGMKLIKAYNMGSKSFQKVSSAIHEGKRHVGIRPPGGWGRPMRPLWSSSSAACF